MRIPKDRLLARYDVVKASVGKSTRLIKRFCALIVVLLVIAGFVLVGL